MKNYVRALEIPIYLFMIAFACLEKGYNGIAIFLFILSILRLIVNVTFDDMIYKR